MRRQWSTALVSLCVTAVVALGFAGVTFAAEKAVSAEPVYSESSPNEPKGAPDSSFIQDMQALYQEAPAPASEPRSIQSIVDGVSRLSVKPIATVPEPVNVWSDKVDYRIGEEARIFFRIPRAAYVYIINVDAAGQINLVFPNPSDRNPFINRAGNFSLPRGNYKFPVTGPAGREHLLMVASSEPISYFERVADRGGNFTAVDNAGQIIRFFSDWKRSTPAWSSMAWNTFNVMSGSSWYGPRNQSPSARMQASETKVTMGASVTFYSRGSVDPDGRIREYRWDFNGDGRMDATGETARYTFSSPGVYTAKLTVEDNQGATDTTTVQIVVEARKTLLEIDADSKSRAVYIDGAYAGNGSVRQYVNAGSHNIKIVGPDNLTYSSVIDVAPGMRTITIEVEF